MHNLTVLAFANPTQAFQVRDALLQLQGQSLFGIDIGFIHELGATITPGTSALAILGSKGNLDGLGKRLGPLLQQCTILRTNVDAEREHEIRKLLAACDAPAPRNSQPTKPNE